MVGQVNFSSNVVAFWVRLRDFSEWGQCQILELLRHYHPASEEEVFDLLVSGEGAGQFSVRWTGFSKESLWFFRGCCSPLK